MSTVVIGARNEEQLRQNLGAVGWNLDAPSRVREARSQPARSTPARIRTIPYWHQAGSSERNPTAGLRSPDGASIRHESRRPHPLPADRRSRNRCVDVELPKPVATGHDLLVRIEAISVNPVDTKVRAPKPQVEAQPKVLGYDAAGVVEAVGDAVTLFKPGDAVFYAGDITRSGSNAQFQLVDERIVGRKPTTLDFAQAAALPLTAHHRVGTAVPSHAPRRRRQWTPARPC